MRKRERERKQASKSQLLWIPTKQNFSNSIKVNKKKRSIRTTILGGKAVDGVISLALGTNVAREGVGGERAGVTTVLINITNVELDRGVVLGTDQAVSGRARRRR